MQMYSPLRYPGGKSRLSKFIGQAICNLQIHNCTYIEPFAGGAGVALSLLFIYFDPPYYKKGQKLYKNFFTPTDHKRIHDVIAQEIQVPWIITYDDVDAISELYQDYTMRKFDLTYSAANKGTASELMIFSDIEFCPTPEQMIAQKININFRE